MIIGWRSAVFIGGAGAVGSLLRRCLADQADSILSLDLLPPGDGSAHLIANVAALNEEARSLLSGADLVVWSLPLDETSQYLSALIALISPSALFVETSSAQAVPARLLGEAPFESLGVNPLFAPSLPMTDRPIAVITIRPGARGPDFIKLLAFRGAQVVSLEADEHDRIMAWTQAMTHAALLGFGYALMKSGMNVDTLLRVAPPPHQTLLALLARLATGAPHVYFDIQCGNACASEARKALQMGMAAVAAAALDERAFNDLMARLREWLGERAAPLAQQSQRMFVAGQDLTLEEKPGSTIGAQRLI